MVSGCFWVFFWWFCWASGFSILWVQKSALLRWRSESILLKNGVTYREVSPDVLYSRSQLEQLPNVKELYTEDVFTSYYLRGWSFYPISSRFVALHKSREFPLRFGTSLYDLFQLLLRFRAVKYLLSIDWSKFVKFTSGSF